MNISAMNHPDRLWTAAMGKLELSVCPSKGQYGGAGFQCDLGLVLGQEKWAS